MKVVTDIKQQSKNNKRVNLYLDGNFYCGLDLITVMKYRIKIGMEITESKIIEIQYAEEKNSALDYALASLSKSIKTEKEIKQKLLRKGYLLEIVDEVVLRLKELGYLNDCDYAERYLSSYSSVKGKRLMKLELRQKGVDDKIIDDASENIENELETAVRIAEKYTKSKDKDIKTMQKCYKYLLSKGFSYDDSKTASERVLNMSSSDDFI